MSDEETRILERIEKESRITNQFLFKIYEQLKEISFNILEQIKKINEKKT